MYWAPDTVELSMDWDVLVQVESVGWLDQVKDSGRIGLGDAAIADVQAVGSHPSSFP